MHLVHRQTCRVCGSRALTKVNDLGEQYLQGSFVRPGKEMPPTRRIPLALVRCDPTRDEHACGLLQLSHTTPSEILYAAYWYRSGTNTTMRQHLTSIAEEAASFTAGDTARVLDIGCNDGTLLDAYPETFVKFGIDPSDLASEVSEGITVIRDTFPSEALRASTSEPFDIITAIAMFYDLEDPVRFVSAVKEWLAPEGVWIFEMSYMPLMLEMNAYDTICHEHLEYYSLAVLDNIMDRADMKIVQVGINDTNGGSIRCHATHKTNLRWDSAQQAASLSILKQREFDLELDTDRPYRNFQERIDTHRDELRNLLVKLKRAGKIIHIYGASTKGNTILQWCGIDASLIDMAADRNPDKHGARTLGTDIPIVSEVESRSLRPDYYLVLPWHFRKEFVERERAILDGGTKMIFPLPQVEVFGL